MIPREEHLTWCKLRAREYLERGDVKGAITSMLSDLSKHPDTKLPAASLLNALGIAIMVSGDHAAARSFIDGFH